MNQGAKPEFKLDIDRSGNLDFGKMQKELASSLKDSIFGALPDEYFNNEVGRVFKAMTEPRTNLKATGDTRCEACKVGYYAKKECPHNLVGGPSEIHEIFYKQFREIFANKAKDLATRWVDGAVDDLLIVSRLEKMVESAGKAFLAQTSSSIIKTLMAQHASTISQFEQTVANLDISKFCTGCKQPIISGGRSCPNCGLYNE